MFCNTAKGIELSGVGNANWPAPVIGTFTTSGASGTATGGDIIELFYDSTCTSTCQGKDYIATVTADGSGNWNYTGSLNTSRTLVATATGVGPPPGNVDNTSEFACAVVLPVEYAYFKAELMASAKVNLSWETFIETDHDHFLGWFRYCESLDQ